jgi:hypothetical protein
VAISNHDHDKGECTSSYGGKDARCRVDPVFSGCTAAAAPLIGIVNGYTTLRPLKIVPQIVPPIVQKPKKNAFFLGGFCTIEGTIRGTLKKNLK